MAILVGFGEIVAGAVGWTGLHAFRAYWILLAPTLLVPGLPASVLWPIRRKWKLLERPASAVVVGAVLMLPMLHIVQDRGVRRDIPVLEDAWA